MLAAPQERNARRRGEFNVQSVTSEQRRTRLLQFLIRDSRRQSTAVPKNFKC